MNSRKKRVRESFPLAAALSAVLLLPNCAIPTGHFVASEKSHPASPEASEGAIEDPGRFLDDEGENSDIAAPAEHGQPEMAESRYVCPMHPDVTAESPGNCPRCGMALKERKPEAKEEHHHEH